MTDWRDSPTVRGVRAWENRDNGEGIMTLEAFINLNYEAAILLYKTGRMRLLTDDPYYLEGHATDAEAMVLLLQHQLTHKNVEDLTRASRNHREVREGTRPKRTRTLPYKGIGPNGPSWHAYGHEGGRKLYLGTFKTAREAAVAFDEWAGPRGRKTNADLGLL